MFLFLTRIFYVQTSKKLFVKRNSRSIQSIKEWKKL